MKYTLFLILIISLLISTEALADDERYRVEVLVLLHLQHAEPGEVSERLRDYSNALDFLTPIPEPEPLPPGCEPEQEVVAVSPEDGFTTDSDAEVPEPESAVEAEAEEGSMTEEAIDPNAVIHITDMGPEMQEAWRRLRLSGPFRPLQYLAWEQGSSEPFPTLRVHDLQLVLEDDPYADLRAAEDELEALYGTEPAAEPGPAELTDNALPDCSPPPEDTLPEPVRYYALDGTVSLLRSRFLHLVLDLQLREPLQAPPGELETQAVHALLPGVADQGQAVPAESQPEQFRVYALKQRRQVRSDRMEYFDNPVLGVLAWITPVVLEEPRER